MKYLKRKKKNLNAEKVELFDFRLKSGAPKDGFLLRAILEFSNKSSKKENR